MNIGFDFDGVIGDCSQLKIDAAKKLFGIKLSEKDLRKKTLLGDGILTIKQYEKLRNYIYQSQDSLHIVKPVKDMVLYVNKLIDNSHDLSIITSRSDNALKIAKELLLNWNLGLDCNSSGRGNSKLDHALRLNLEAYIDDDYRKLEDLIGKIPRLFLFTWEYNRYDRIDHSHVSRVSNWHDLYRALQHNHS